MSETYAAESKAIAAAIEHLELLKSIERDECARDRLASDQANHVSQIARSAVLLLDQQHGLAFNILLRAITDSIFRTAWGLSSEDNANALEQTAHNDFRRNVKSLIKDGNLSFTDATTGKTLDGHIIELAVVQAGSKSTNVRAMAAELGLEVVYQLLYKPLSMQSHGSYGVVASKSQPMTRETRASALGAGVQLITKMAGSWLALRKVVSTDEIRSFFFPSTGP